MLTKTRLKEQIEKFPEEFSLDDLIENLILLEKIETGNKQSENGDVISENEMENEIKKWFE
jgi:Zn-dependent alcohol dehydrogenase